VGEKLKVWYVPEGRVQKAGNPLWVTARPVVDEIGRNIGFFIQGREIRVLLFETVS
jgi:TolB-like protein